MQLQLLESLWIYMDLLDQPNIFNVILNIIS